MRTSECAAIAVLACAMLCATWTTSSPAPVPEPATVPVPEQESGPVLKNGMEWVIEGEPMDLAIIKLMQNGVPGDEAYNLVAPQFGLEPLDL